MLETFKSLKAKLMSIKEDKIKKFEEQWEINAILLQKLIEKENSHLPTLEE
jgi:hypothetical protein